MSQTVERKLTGAAELAPMANALLAANCLPDGEFPEGNIQSVYFDSPALVAYQEKANGDNLKAKLRLRWYDTDAPEEALIPAFLEVKERIGATRDKSRVRLSLPAAFLRNAPLNDPRWTELLREHVAALHLPLSRAYIPSLSISYQRRRWICPQTQSRIAVDWNIAARRFHPLLFPTISPVHLEESLCEFKNPSGAPPPWLEHLFTLGYRLRSHSKYGALIERALHS